MRKRIVAVLTAMLFVVLCFALAACSGVPAHTHTSSTKWSNDETSHWKECVNEDCTTVVVAKSKHTIKSGSNACESCNYVDLSIFTITNGVLTECRPGAYTSITIPDSVTIIGSSAFSGCSSLASITIPSSVTSISTHAFFECKGLTNIEIPSSVTSIGEYAFYNCRKLTSITIPSSVTSIGEYAFWGCSGLTSINMPSSMTAISDGTFKGCSSLTIITIPKSVISIGYAAFSLCSGLTSITIPSSVASIDEYAFSGCSGITSITVAEGNSNYIVQDGIMYNMAKTELILVPQKIAGAVVIPEGITSIGEKEFYNCNSLTSITIPESVTSIGFSAFNGCSGLTSITLPFVGGSKDGTNNTHFGYIFGASSAGGYSSNSKYVPTSLKTVVITGGAAISSSAFYNCSSLISIMIPESVTSIGNQAFFGCIGLTSITIPSCVTSIGYEAFYGCRLTSITIGNGVTAILSYAFASCSSLASISYNGTTAEWESITKSSNWNRNTGNYTVTCTDGTLTK